MLRYEIENKEHWRERINEIPFLQFPQDWMIKIIPPFGGAMARFIVEKQGKRISVYLDFDNALGWWEGPYWEIYPFEDDVYRCGINETQELIDAIAKALSED